MPPVSVRSMPVISVENVPVWLAGFGSICATAF